MMVIKQWAVWLFFCGVCCYSVQAQTSSGPCSPTTCIPPDCFCPGQQSPLPPDQTPQFILFTHDDVTGPLSVSLIQNATKGFTNPNGCQIPATFFTMKFATECEWVNAAWQAGHEIATHTISHLSMDPDFTAGVGSIYDEIVGMKDYLVAECGLPADDVIGFRSPYLNHHPGYREALYKGGFLYDSTINEHWPMPTSPSGRERIWPYTMDYGIAQDCSWTMHVCREDEIYKGMWEVPVWALQTETYPDPAYVMDPCDGTSGECDTFELLKYVFNQSYTGNKAPVPLYTHSPWLEVEKQMDATRSFISWVTENYPDAYFVTMHQLIQWIQDPVPISEMNEWLGCGPGGRAANANPPTTDPVVAPLTNATNQSEPPAAMTESEKPTAPPIETPSPASTVMIMDTEAPTVPPRSMNGNNLQVESNIGLTKAPITEVDSSKGFTASFEFTIFFGLISAIGLFFQ